MVSLPNGDCFVTHREYIQEVLGTVAFTNTQLSINPGQVNIFPWLSKLARNFESYQFEMLKFIYEPQAPTTEGGSIMLAIDYDASDQKAPTKQQIMSYRSSVRTAPWADMVHSSKKEDLSKQKSYFVRNANQAGGTDIKLYDVGTLQIATQGNTAAISEGELYVEYRVKLMTPQYESEGSLFGGSLVAGGVISAANPLGSVPVVDAQSTGFTIGATSVIVFNQVGTYLVVYRFVGTVITAAPLALTLGAGVTLVNPTQSVIDGGALNAIVVCEFLVSDLSTSTVDITLTATTVTAARVDIATVPTGSFS